MITGLSRIAFDLYAIEELFDMLFEFESLFCYGMLIFWLVLIISIYKDASARKCDERIWIGFEIGFPIGWIFINDLISVYWFSTNLGFTILFPAIIWILMRPEKVEKKARQQENYYSATSRQNTETEFEGDRTFQETQESEQIRASMSEESSKENTCPNCGKQIQETWNVCTYCGTEINNN